MVNLPKLTDLDVTDKKVLVRGDLDVDTSETYRLEALLPTLKYLFSKSSKIILLGHRGRPQGKVVEELKMKPVEEELRKIATGIEFEVLENLRFDSGEENNDIQYAKNLASLADVYVNEAFANSHREHASIVGLPKFLPHAAGLRFVEEVNNLSKVFDNPKRPVVFIVGGSKKDKLDYLEDLKSVADKILVGGRLPDYLQDTRYSLPVRQAGMLDTKIIVANLLPDKEDLTINSMIKFEEEIGNAGTIVLAGPMGKYEDEGHRQGTERIFKAVVNSKAFKIVGGGDSIKALKVLSVVEGFDWISVGGGAMLEFLAKRTLPGIKALESANLNTEGG